MKCPQCQQEKWEEGVIAEARGSALTFKPKRTKFLVLSYPELRAQACLICGHIQLDVDVEKLKGTLKE